MRAHNFSHTKSFSLSWCSCKHKTDRKIKTVQTLNPHVFLWIPEVTLHLLESIVWTEKFNAINKKDKSHRRNLSNAFSSSIKKKDKLEIYTNKRNTRTLTHYWFLYKVFLLPALIKTLLAHVCSLYSQWRKCKFWVTVQVYSDHNITVLCHCVYRCSLAITKCTVHLRCVTTSQCLSFFLVFCA